MRWNSQLVALWEWRKWLLVYFPRTEVLLRLVRKLAVEKCLLTLTPSYSIHKAQERSGLEPEVLWTFFVAELPSFLGKEVSGGYHLSI